MDIYFKGVANWGSRQSENYHRSFERTFELLSSNPELARERPEITPPVRIHPHGAHLIVYRIDDNQDVYIIRVRHGSEDWKP